MSATTPAAELATATEDLARVRSELKAAIAVVEGLRRSGRGASGELLRKEGVSFAEFDAAILAREALRRAETAAQARLTRAQAAATPARLTPAQAAEEALRFHAIAVDAQRAATEAFAAREAMWVAAGRPGRPWKDRSDLGARSADVDGGASVVRSVTRAMADGFDFRATKLVADGAPAVPALRTATGPDNGSDQSRAFDAPAEY